MTTEKLQELPLLTKEVGAQITEEYAAKFSQIFESLGLFSEFADTGPIPVEVWIGVAQALADASGYRVTLEAAIWEPPNDDAETSLIVGRRAIATVDPTLFVKEA